MFSLYGNLDITFFIPYFVQVAQYEVLFPLSTHKGDISFTALIGYQERTKWSKTERVMENCKRIQIGQFKGLPKLKILDRH